MIRRGLLIGAVLCAITVIAGAGYVGFKHFNQPLIATSITDKLTSALYVANGPSSVLDKQSVKYDDQLKQLSYVTKSSIADIIVSEQPSPEVFGDVPQYFDKWVESAGAISNFDTPNGKVYIASNPKYGVNSVAILNSNGTLLFAKPSKNLTTDQWKLFFRNLKLQQ